jgi:hypothetical protein
MSTLQVNTIETNTPAGVLAVRDVNNALTAIQPSALRGTAANTAPIFQDSAGTPIGTLCRAWVNFNGTGTVTIRAAFNVSSITDGGAGTYGINFINYMPDADYAFVGSGRYVAGNSNTTSGGTVLQDNAVTPTTNSFGVMTVTKDNSTRIDNPFICIAVFR